jgi:phosphatidylinositol kinase/protein kinase (PI-3  family)
MSRGAANADYVEFELTRALEWLRTDRSDRRLAAALVLRELSRNSPTIFFAKTNHVNGGGGPGGSNEFVSFIFPVLRDRLHIVRICGAAALSGYLRILANRQARSNTDKYCKIYKEMQEGFQKTNSVEALHGALLVVGEMLDHTGDFMLPRFEEVCDSVISLAEHKKTMIRISVAELIPRLARRCPSAFGRRYLDICLKFLLKNAAKASSSSSQEMRPVCFISIGQLTLALQINSHPPRRFPTTNPNSTSTLPPPLSSRAGIYNYLDEIFNLVHEGLKSGKSTKSSACTCEALHCAADLVEALGEQSQPYISSLVDEMFNAGLSNDLILALQSISMCSPAHQNQIKERLLQELSVCLAGTPDAYSVTERNAIFPASSSSLPPKPAQATQSKSSRREVKHRESNNDISAYSPIPSDGFLSSHASSTNMNMGNTPNSVMSSHPSFTNNRPTPLSLLSSPRHAVSSQNLASTPLSMRATDSQPHFGSNGSAKSPIPMTNSIYAPPPLRKGAATLPTSNPPAPPPSASAAASSSSASAISQMTRFLKSNMNVNPATVEKLTLSLSTLSTFSLEMSLESSSICSTILPFVGAVVAAYLDHPSTDVRQEAALTCCRLLLPSNTRNQNIRDSRSRSVRRNNLKPSPVPRVPGPSGRVIEQVLVKLLRVAVSDPSPEVRQRMVLALDNRYDLYLCQAHHLSTLFLLVQDEVFAIRASALKLLGRLAVMNPAYVLPSLRQVLMRIILELQCNGDTGVRESATRTLIVFLRASALQRLVRPFLRSLIAVLPLNSPNRHVAPRLASAALEALGELALVVQEGIRPWLHELIPHIIMTMQDQSSVSKQQTSLRTLGQIIGATGYVIEPYLAYPKLMPIAAAVLPATKNAPWNLRCEVLRTFGILGALEPQRVINSAEQSKKINDNLLLLVDAHKTQTDKSLRKTSNPNSSSAIDILPAGGAQIAGASSVLSIAPNHNRLVTDTLTDLDMDLASSSLALSGNSDDEPAHVCMYEQCAMTAQPVSSTNPFKAEVTPSSEDFFPTVAVNSLMKILKDPSLAVHHSMVMQAVMFIFSSLGLRCVQFLDHILPHMLMVVRSCNQQTLRESLLQQLAALSSIVGQHLRPFLPEVMQVVTEFWKSHLPSALVLVEKMASNVPDDFRSYIPTLVSFLIPSLESREDNSNEAVSLPLYAQRLTLVLSSIRRLKPVLGEYLQLLVPALVKQADALTSGSSDQFKDAEEVATSKAAAKSSSKNAPTPAAVQQALLNSAAVNLISTVGYLLHTSSSSHGNSSGWKNRDQQPASTLSPMATVNELCNAIGSVGFHNNSREALPARVSQPLFRILARADLTVGTAIVEALCVICKAMGLAWVEFQSRSSIAIVEWEARVSSQANPSTKSGEKKERLPVVRLYFDTAESMRELQNIVAVSKSSPSNINFFSDAPVVAAIDRSFREVDNIFHAVELAISLNQNDNSLPQFGQSKLHPNQQNLQRAWDVSQRTTRDDWDEWMRRFAVQLLREAPSPALRACADLAQAYPPLARELFKAAFVSCWFELVDQYQENLVRSLETAFKSDTIPPEILQTLLNLAEFMEHDVEALPIDIRVLADLAQKCRAYAKALHYKELEYETSPMTCVESMISINKKLDLPEAALGVLKAVQNLALEAEGGTPGLYSSIHDPQYDNSDEPRDRGRTESTANTFVGQRVRRRSSVANSDAGDYGSFRGVEVKESFLAKLGSWSEALVLYERNLQEDENDTGAILGCMRCLDARGEWESVLKLATKSWDALQGKLRQMHSSTNFTASDIIGARAENGRVPTDTELEARKLEEIANSERDYKKAVKFCCHAAWRLGKWAKLEVFAGELVRGDFSKSPTAPASVQRNSSGGLNIDFDGAFYSVVLHIHRKEWRAAAGAINAARMAMDSRFTALMAESYKRAYPSMVTAQMLAEMEEIIELRKLEERASTYTHSHKANLNDPVEHKAKLLETWRKRLAGCRVDAWVHNSILAVRSLVLSPTDDIESTLTLAALCRQSQNFKLGEKVLLDPLKSLGADLNGIVFGHEDGMWNGGSGSGEGMSMMTPVFGANASNNPPPVLNLSNSGGMSSNQMLMSSSSSAPVVNMDPMVAIDRIVSGIDDTKEDYTAMHEQHATRIVNEAGGIQSIHVQHSLYYAYVKHIWAFGGKSVEARKRLSQLASTVDLISATKPIDNGKLRVKCWLTLGHWKLATQAPNSVLKPELVLDVVKAYKRATIAGENEYKSWHAWGLLNFRLSKQFKRSSHRGAVVLGNMRRHSAPSKQLKNHIVASVNGFLKAISLGKKRWSASVQQDMLNFLTVLFNNGEVPEVIKAINDGLGAVTLEMWLGVLPQLLARIQVRSVNIRNVLHGLLVKLGAKHPQALMYPLSVLLKSPVDDRKQAAEQLMGSLRGHSDKLVEQALLVSSELIRVAILWHEMWHEGLEEASRIYFAEGNVQGMLDVLLPLHQQLEAGASTRREEQFAEAFGRDLCDAHQCVKKYIAKTKQAGRAIPTEGGYPVNNADGGVAVGNSRANSEAEAALNQAWDLYYTAFRRINKQLPSLTTLELSACSPALLRATNLQLGIPGTYRVDGSYVRIKSFSPSVQVITSKQRPRKITLKGDDGRDYTYLLKGHEDLRQDERVMQLFGLVNALLAKDRRTNNHDLSIQRYAVTPLSHNAGVVGWVPHCDTLHSLIRDYRDTRKVLLNMEHRLMMKMAPDYDLLTMLQKVEVFENALAKTTGKDLYQVLWLKSKDSEEWLERRTNYTRSLAVMSMVGYILGLGDRHPSNLMLDRGTGKLLHIDFGDCFEVAMNRPKFPEKIPFRLTRMLINALEVSGIEGSYRATCERTMGVLRDNRDSLIAMLEAFVYDPLISWRLTGNKDEKEAGAGAGEMKETDKAKTAENGSDNGAKAEAEAAAAALASAAAASKASQATVEEGEEEEEEEEKEEEEDGGGVRENGEEGKRDVAADASGAAANANGEDMAPPAPPPLQREKTRRAHSNDCVAVTDMTGSVTENLNCYLRNQAKSGSGGGGGEGEGALEGHQMDHKAAGMARYNEMVVMSSQQDSRIMSLTTGNSNAYSVSVAKSRLDDKNSTQQLMSLLGPMANDGGVVLNEKALDVIKRVQDKLSGTDFGDVEPLGVPEQVRRLIVQATSNENLSLCFIGWCAFW